MKSTPLLDRHAPTPSVVIVGLLGVVMTGFVDFVTGYEVSMFIFYGVPILAVAWFVGRRWAIFTALAAGLVWWWADQMALHPYRWGWLQGWETCVRLTYFLFVALCGAALKSYYDAVKSRIALLEHSNKLEQEIVAISEQEQRRLGHDLHDGICQQLTALRFSATSLCKDLQTVGREEWASKVRDIADRLKSATSQVRELAHGLAPVEMDEAGLAAALEELSLATSRMLGIDCAFHVKGSVTVVDHKTATNLYRIAQEGLNNAVKHAKADRIEISLTGDSDTLELWVDDNGCGIRPNDAHAPGRGLRIMQYRSGYIGAALEVQRKSAGGTAVRCKLRQENCAQFANGDKH